MGLFGSKKKLHDAAPDAKSAATPAAATGANAPAEKKPGIFTRLIRGLGKTMRSFVGGIATLVTGRKIDADLIEEIHDALILADVGPAIADKVCDDLRAAWKKKEIEDGEQVLPFLKAEFKRILTARGNSLHIAPNGPTVILVVGVNGTGKTTSIGKLSHWLKSQGKKVLIAAGDTFRAAAESQLRVWAEDRVGVDFHQGEPKAHPAAVAYTAAERALAEGHDIVIVDTAGRLHTQKNLMQELEKIKKSIAKVIPDAPHEVLLVLDANIGLNSVQQAENFKDTAGVTGLFLAKLDATGKGGVVLHIHQKFDIPVKFVGLGEQMADIAPFDAEQFVDALFSETGA